MKLTLQETVNSIKKIQSHSQKEYDLFLKQIKLTHEQIMEMVDFFEAIINNPLILKDEQNN